MVAAAHPALWTPLPQVAGIHVALRLRSPVADLPARLADADTGRTIGLAIKELRMRDPRVRGGGGLLRGNIFDAGGHEQCVPAGPPPPPLCTRSCFCRLPHTCGFSLALSS